MKAAKLGILVFWLLCALTFFWTGGFASLLRVLFWATLAIHAIEFAVFFRALQRAPGSLGHHFVQTMLYGYFHIGPARSGAARGATAG